MRSGNRSVLVNISMPGIERGDKLVTVYGDQKVFAEVQDVKVQSDKIIYFMIIIAGPEELLGEKFELPVDRRQPVLIPVLKKTKLEALKASEFSLGELMYVIRSLVGDLSYMGYKYKKPSVALKDAHARAMALGFVDQTNYRKFKQQVKKICHLYPEYVSLNPARTHVGLVSYERQKVMEKLGLIGEAIKEEERRISVDFDKFCYGMRLILESLGVQIVRD
jgi:hypothetical protein